MVGEVKAALAPSGLPEVSVHSSPASLPPSKSQSMVLLTGLVPRVGSVIETEPGQVAVYWMATWAGSLQAPAVPVLVPRVKVLVAGKLAPALYCHSPVKLSTVPPDPIW